MFYVVFIDGRFALNPVTGAQIAVKRPHDR
jgi:hypothetical protein